MPEPKWRKPQPNKVVATLEEINRYRVALGLAPLRSLFELTERRPEQELNSLKQQWAEKVGGIGGAISQLPRGITGGWYQPPQFEWAPAGATAAPVVAPAVPTAPSAEDEMLRRLANLELEKFDLQKQQALRQETLDISARDYNRWLAERNIAANAQQFAWDIAQQRFAAKDVGMQRQLTGAQRRVNELEFERDRAEMLKGIPSNDWITQWTLQNQPNPYKKQEVSPIDQLEANLDNLTGTIQKYETEAVLAANAEAAGQRYHITSEEAQSVVTDLQGRRESLEKTWKTVQDESRGWSPQPVPQPYPNAPGWLPQYAPGLQAGQMITRQNVPTPSGQQLTAMSQNQLEQLGYFGKWAGQLTGKYPWEELTESARLMQPRTPSGAGGFGWTPSRQV